MPVEVAIREAVKEHGVLKGWEAVREGIASGRIDPTKIHLKGLAVAFMGENWAQAIDQYTAGVRESQYVDASNFATIGGQLLVTRVKDAYELHKSFVDEVFRVDPIGSNLEDEIVPWKTRVQDRARAINAGMPVTRSTAVQHYLRHPKPTRFALSCGITKEMIRADQNGVKQAYDIADSVGEQVRLTEREKKLRVFFGLINPHNWNGVGYNTFRLTGQWVNYSQAFTLASELDINVLEQFFVNMLDPVTNTPIKITPKHMFVMPLRNMLARRILNSVTVTEGTVTTSNVRTEGKGQLTTGYQLFTCPHARQLLLTEGLGTYTNAARIDSITAVGDFSKTFIWRQVEPTSVQYAGPGHWADFECSVPVLVKAESWGEAGVDDPRFTALGFNNTL